MTDSIPPPWWRHAAIYQVYIRSFADGNGDGVGDLAGLRSRLPYLSRLGIDAVWVNPWYPSPLNDGGYDVANYRDINPTFGTMEEAEALIDEAAGYGIRVLADLVPNHTSSDHRWFRAALESEPGSAARRRYHFLPGSGPAGDRPPTNWVSAFGGSAWSRCRDGEWYLHLFDPSQPDLNWANPDVRSEFRDILRFWLDRGLAGFRVDVAHSLTKDMTWPDVAEPGGGSRAEHPHWDRNDVHGIVREWRSVLDEYPGTMMVAEAWVDGWHRLSRYLRPDEYHQAFNFDFLERPWDPVEFRDSIDTSLRAAAAVGSVPSWVLSNHDVVRHTTRYALPDARDAKSWLLQGDRGDLDEVAGLRRARAAALLMLALPGSVYLYQGEELGLPEAYDLPIAVLDDPVWQRSGHTRKGRDGCRVPMPWSSDEPSLGFGANGAWLPQPPAYRGLSAESQDGIPGSTLELYRSALRIRREALVGDEDFTWLDLDQGTLAFQRGSGVVCIANLGNSPLPLPDGQVVISSEGINDGTLPVDAAVWLNPEPAR